LGRKAFGGASSSSEEDLDSKLFGKSDLSFIGDFFGLSETEDKAKGSDLPSAMSSSNSVITMQDLVLHIFDGGLPFVPPPRESVKESVDWGILR
jgi:hypothetical protein